MFNLETIFDGWGTYLISLIITALLGGGAIYCVRKHRIKQKQQAGDRSSQKQSIKGAAKNIKQSQRAGDDSEQIQEG